jgi:spermidine/putrescine transport system permease protein
VARGGTNIGALDGAARKADSRTGILTALPAGGYLLIFFFLPLLIIIAYSFATRTATGRTELNGWNFESYEKMIDSLVLGIVWRSFWLAGLTTILCLLVGYPFAYYLATRPAKIRNVMLVLVMIPFWTNGLIRIFAIRFLLGSDGPISQASETLGFGQFRILFTPTAVVIGMLYSFLTFMILPLYVAIERMDWKLVEAARDLYADGTTTFRKVTLPLTKSGVIAGSVLVFIPSFGSYVVPEILGGAKTLLLGSYIARQFGQARNWPFGAALSVVLIIAMLIAVVINQRSQASDLIGADE